MDAHNIGCKKVYIISKYEDSRVINGFVDLIIILDIHKPKYQEYISNKYTIIKYIIIKYDIKR